MTHFFINLVSLTADKLRPSHSVQFKSDHNFFNIQHALLTFAYNVNLTLAMNRIKIIHFIVEPDGQ